MRGYDDALEFIRPAYDDMMHAIEWRKRYEEQLGADDRMTAIAKQDEQVACMHMWGMCEAVAHVFEVKAIDVYKGVANV